MGQKIEVHGAQVVQVLSPLVAGELGGDCTDGQDNQRP
jgi:hypothetical protein